MSFRSRSVDFWATINGGALVELYKVVGSRDHARFVAAAMQLHGLTEGQANDALARFAEEEQWPIPSRTQSGGGGAGPSGVTPRAVVPATAPPIVGPRPNTLSLTRPRSVEGAPHLSQSGAGMDCEKWRTSTGMGETSRNIRSGSRASCRRSGEARAIEANPPS